MKWDVHCRTLVRADETLAVAAPVNDYDKCYRIVRGEHFFKMHVFHSLDWGKYQPLENFSNWISLLPQYTDSWKMVWGEKSKINVCQAAEVGFED